MKRQSFILGSAAAAAATPLWLERALAASQSLKDAAAAKGIVYGANFRDVDLLTGDSQFAGLVVQQLADIESGRSFQWANTEPQPNKFTFDAADAFMDWGMSHGLKVSECHLVWHNSEGPWLKRTINSSNWQDILTTHIKTLVSRYAGKMYSWVVVNESLNPKDGLPGGLRNSFWIQAGGQDVIDTAFRVAAEADPKAILLYNDYGVERDVPASIEKRKLMLDMLSGMVKRGVPINALGIQAHLDGDPSGFNAPGLVKFIDDVASLGLKTWFTELDIGDDKLPNDPSTRDQVAAKMYTDFLGQVLANKNVPTIIQWSFADKYNWRNDWTPGGVSKQSGTPARGFPFGDNLEQTPVYDAILQAFNNAPSR
jgi:endo-1,4-beta-xylanase